MTFDYLQTSSKDKHTPHREDSRECEILEMPRTWSLSKYAAGSKSCSYTRIPECLEKYKHWFNQHKCCFHVFEFKSLAESQPQCLRGQEATSKNVANGECEGRGTAIPVP